MASPIAIVAYLGLFAGVAVLFLFVNLLLGRFLRPRLPNQEKLEVYECGEPTIGSSFVQFDLRFYVVALLFVIMKPASRQSVTGSTPSDMTASTSTAPPQSSQADVERKPALAEFKALLASPPSQPATHEQSQQLLQNFLQWRKKASTTETSQ